MTRNPCGTDDPGHVGTFGTITGCNTVAGAGKDIERGGEAIHDSAKDVQQKM